MAIDFSDILELKPFIQHGFKPVTMAGKDEAVGDCIFCNKPQRLYVNIINKTWKCQVCGKEGGYQKWLQQVQMFVTGNFKGTPMLDLCMDRGLGLNTFRKNKLGYNPHTREIVIPVWMMEGDGVYDLRFRRKKKMWSTSGNSVGLYNWQTLTSSVKTIWICEGEWDGLAMDEVFGKMRFGFDMAWVAVPGAGTFKAEWAIHFKDKIVNVAYDCDKAGKDGTIKVYNQLKSIARELNFVHWPADTIDGFDFRDLYVKKHAGNATATWKDVVSYLKPEPTGVADETKSTTAGASKGQPKAEVVKLDGDGMLHEDVYKTYQGWLHLPDTEILDFMFGVVIANRQEGDPIWGQIMGPSGATKTELLVSLDDAPMITTVSSLTPHSLVSGANFSGGGDPSLIPRWHEKVVIIKDLTVLLSLNQTYREEIFSILRDAYDGKTERNFGNGVFRSYKSHFGMLCGVTPAIELFTENHSALGERFLRFPVPVPEDMKGRIAFSRRAMANTTHEVQMRNELREVGKRVLNHKFGPAPSVGTKMEEKLLNLAQFTSLMRSTIQRDNFTKEITHKPFSELGTRLTKQFYKLMVHGVGTFRRAKDVGEHEYSVIRKISLGTVPSRMEGIVRGLHKKNVNGSFTVKDVSTMMQLPQATVHRQVEALAMLHVLKQSAHSASKPEYHFTKDILEVISTCELYKEKK
jgi:hypothetical protein